MSEIADNPWEASRPRRGFWSWWRDGLCLWLRPGHAPGVPEPRVWLQSTQEPGFVANAGLEPAAGNPAIDVVARFRQLPLWLAITADRVVRMPLQLPLAALDHLHESIGFQIERLTPFKRTEVASAIRVNSRDPLAGTASLELVVMPRSGFEAMLGQLQAERIGPLSGVDVIAHEGRVLGINLLPETMRAPAPHPWRRWNAGFAAVTVMGIIAGLALGLQRERQQVAALEFSLAAQTSQARAVSAQRDRLRALTEGADWVARSRAAQPQIVPLMDALAERIPAHTVLEQMRMQKDELQIQGIGPNSAELIGSLRGASAWGQPALMGTTTAMGASDRFSIRLPLNAPTREKK